MYNLYQSQPVKIIKIKKQSPVVKLFTLQFLNKNLQKKFYWQPGQFIEVGLPGFGEAPFALCSDPEERNFFELSIRKIGQLTNKIHELKIGDKLFVRGPFGNGLPEVDKPTLLVVGGLGLIPFRSLILNQIRKGLAKKIMVFYGAKTPKDFLFKDEFKKWEKAGVKLYLTIDKTCLGWDGCVGLVTVLFDKVFGSFSQKSNIQYPVLSILCGPSVMYKFVLEKLYQYGFKEENIYLLLERRIHCGVGICQHCAIGSKYVCKDGPVFKYSEIKDIEGVI